MSSSMTEDDPIVCEIPVHLAENLRKNVFMVQFPLRPAYRPMPQAPRAARIKPAHQILQLDYDLDHKSEHFDGDAEDYLKQKHLRLQSSSVPALTNYAVGVFREGQLHLTPISGVLQMRPSLAHIDEAVDDVEEDVDMAMEEEQKEAENAVKEVQFQFKKKQSERAISAIQNSYAYKKQQINAETWRELRVFDKESATTETEFENLFSEREEDVISTMTTEEYLRALRYRHAGAAAATTGRPETTSDAEEKEERSATASVDPNHLEVLQRLMTDHILHFSDLVELLPSRPEDELAEAVRHVAVSIRGRLLPKSSFVCSSEEATRTREAILNELSKKPVGVSRMELVEKHGLDADAVKKILENFAVLDQATRQWSFKRPHDDTFAKRFASVAKAIKL
ncbi:hypothetical protein Poli38472_001481 [Pythium oligandrum]|uniref:DNA-directed RNA polymerase III subunit RPC5 n=1 Tax=Pythium oligandrum TaxID=41045 RepID=A0A8K1CTI8_PYTOL|nr:hypothetical protein Poli38472_001481 [Pythium oligandrum]|eukprot:TMW69325.1 hypothetical protein Poli38472_001481 [Pythium oligandrum]